MLPSAKKQITTLLRVGKTMFTSFFEGKSVISEITPEVLRGKMFFVLGCARSGTTSLCRILDTASNAKCLMEPIPNMNVESRQHLEGVLENPLECLLNTIPERAFETIKNHKLYGEKNNALFAFIEELYKLFNCKFIFIIRDGRSVVQSMHNWHNELFGNFYRECREKGNLSPAAEKVLSELPLEDDTSNYSRPRPGPDDPCHDKWANMTRHEMLSWYWSFVNNYTLDKLSNIPTENQIIVDYSNPASCDIQAVFDFLGLEGFDRDTVECMLGKKINSLCERTGETQKRRDWREWTEHEILTFQEIAGATMRRLGFCI